MTKEPYNPVYIVKDNYRGFYKFIEKSKLFENNNDKKNKKIIDLNKLVVGVYVQVFKFNEGCYTILLICINTLIIE